jgi:hypothetical protein
LAAYVEAKNWWRPGHGDLHACLEQYALCADNKYHRNDVYGVKFPTTVVPLQARSSMHRGAAHMPSTLSACVCMAQQAPTGVSAVTTLVPSSGDGLMGWHLNC